MHRHNHTPAWLLTTKGFPNPAFLPSSTRPLQQWEMGPDGVTRESPVMSDPVMSDDPSRCGYPSLPAITTPKGSSSGWDTEMITDDGSNHSRDVEGAAQEMGRMSIDISNFEDDAEMDMTDYDGDTEM
ncbi:hypothetical protein FVEN_g5547 [Fusarium venenatum]|uniref:Uncharacterized protein n=1 Tax=Fusarium venenatum TaxID=56646 RepID=A0A2L2TJR7_9HYPO|nr:uncharacterized protein FVRRES_08360 [Fusarium venenatum]KAG8356855.1 hypothetical protein FVEN_g5547 [Fusarium venenatum]CEI68283.1 unnamed protein product [Fusarium venenatum]